MSLINSNKTKTKTPRNSSTSGKEAESRGNKGKRNRIPDVPLGLQAANKLVSRAEVLLAFAQRLYQPVTDYKKATADIIQAIINADAGEDGEKVVGLLNVALSAVETLLSPWKTILMDAFEAMEHAQKSAERVRQLNRPRRDLPKEVLALIFEFFASEDEGLPSEYAEERTSHGTRALLLTHVCSKWRRLAHSMPLIWHYHFLSLHSTVLPFNRLRHYARLSANKEPCLTILATKPMDLDEATLDRLKSVYEGTPVFSRLDCFLSVDNASLMSRILARLPTSRSLRLIRRRLDASQTGIPSILLPMRFFPVVKEMELQEVDAQWEGIAWSPNSLSQMALTSFTFISSTTNPPLWVSYVLPNLTYLRYNAPKFTTQNVTPTKLIAMPLLKDLCITWRDLVLWFPQWISAPPITHLSISNYWPFTCSKQKIDDCRHSGFGDTVRHVTLLSLRGGDIEGISYFINSLTQLDRLTLKGDATDGILLHLSSQSRRILHKLQHLVVSDYDGQGESIFGFVEYRGKIWETNMNVSVAPLQTVEIIDSPNVSEEMHQRIQQLVYEYSD